MTTSKNLNIDQINEKFEKWKKEQCIGYIDKRNVRFQIDATDSMFVCLKQ